MSLWILLCDYKKKKKKIRNAAKKKKIVLKDVLKQKNNYK